ncbi:MAG: hypothetical protein H0X38_00640 [Planctomycetes bacterium]|nr:hypothetical protein [Planctomycetota bacterium]
MKMPSVLILSKDRDDVMAKAALAFARQHQMDCRIVLGASGSRLDPALLDWEGDFLISYLSPWIVPQALLERARVAAINFHPGPPEYPGIGCFNFAIYEQASGYGVTCHHMKAQVDTGVIVAVRRFPLFATDTVHSLSTRSSANLLILFQEVMDSIISGAPLPESDEYWRRRPYTRHEMLELFRVRPEMPPEEVTRRVKAAEFPGWDGAYVDLAGHRFHHRGPPPSQ